VATRLSDLKRAADRLGIDLECPSSGSHYKFKRGSITYPVPAHNGLRSDIADVYVKKFCKAFDIDREQLEAALDGRAIPARAMPQPPVSAPPPDSGKLN